MFNIKGGLGKNKLFNKKNNRHLVIDPMHYEDDDTLVSHLKEAIRDSDKKVRDNNWIEDVKIYRSMISHEPLAEDINVAGDEYEELYYEIIYRPEHAVEIQKYLQGKEKKEILNTAFLSLIDAVMLPGDGKKRKKRKRMSKRKSKRKSKSKSKRKRKRKGKSKRKRKSKRT
jgi:hypothetical protein